MKLTNLVIALATFATITLSSAAYISTKEITSAVLVDKAKHSIDLPTNGLYHISVEEAYAIDKSEVEQIKFLRCSFARPEFKFSWFCHQQKKDGQVTKYSYAALKQDQETYFKDNVITSVVYEAQKEMLRAEQLRIGEAINNLSKTRMSDKSEKEENYLKALKIAKEIRTFNEKYNAFNQAVVLDSVSDLPPLQKKVYASDLNSIISSIQKDESIASDVVKTTAPYAMLFGISEDKSKLFGGKESVPASLNYHEDDDMLEITKRILKNGRREGGLTHYDNPIERHILSIVDNISGAKSIGDIYKEIIIEEEFKLYSNSFWFSPSFNREVANKFVEYRYNSDNFTIERRFIYQDHLPLICLVLFLTIFAGGHIATTIEQNSQFKKLNRIEAETDEQ
jgi:hypothetical protein